MGSMSKERLEATLKRFLPPSVTLHGDAMKNLLRAFVHPTADAGWNMEVPATYGDAHWRAAVSYSLERRYPKWEKAMVEKVLGHLKTNENQKHMLREVMDLDGGVTYGATYPHAEKNRSTHGQGTVLEAIVDAVMVSYGPVVCFGFVEKVIDAYAAKKGQGLDELANPNPVGALHERVSQHLGSPPHSFINWEFDEVALDPDQPSKGKVFTCKAAVVGAPPGHSVGPVRGQKKVDAKKRAAEELLSDTALQEWLGKQRKAAKVSESGGGAVSAVNFSGFQCKNVPVF